MKGLIFIFTFLPLYLFFICAPTDLCSISVDFLVYFASDFNLPHQFYYNMAKITLKSANKIIKSIKSEPTIIISLVTKKNNNKFNVNNLNLWK